MKNERRYILLFVILSILGVMFCSAVEADLIFGEISVSPLSPTPNSSITISILINGDIPSEVRVTVEECNGRTGVCFSDIQNVTMSLIDNGNYRTSVTLRHTETTYINCTVIAKINDSWVKDPTWKIVNLSEDSNGNANGNGDEGKGIPGFELVFFFVAIGICIVVIGRKRGK